MVGVWIDTVMAQLTITFLDFRMVSSLGPKGRSGISYASVTDQGLATYHGSDDAVLTAGQSGRIFFSGVPPFAFHNSAKKTAGKTSRQGWQSFGDVGHLDAEG